VSDKIAQFRNEIYKLCHSFRHVYVDLKVSIGGEVRTAADLLPCSSNICLSGPAGSGKTTVLRWLAASLAESEDHLPAIFVALRKAPENITHLSARSFIEHCASPKPPSELLDRIEHGENAIILLDGLDEMVRLAQSECRAALDRWTSEWSDSVWFLSTRPHFVGLVPNAFSIAELLPLDDSQIEEYLAKRQRTTDVDNTLSKLEQWPSLRTLAHNPLLLDMLSRLSEEVGELPSSRTELYSSSVDVLLRSWDKTRGIPFGERMSPEQLRRLLSELAFKMTAGEQTSLDASDLLTAIPQDQRAKAGVPSEDMSLLRSAFLTKPEPTRFEFVHKSFQEYFAALAIASRPAPSTIAAITGSVSDTLLEFVANLSAEPEQLVSELIKQGQIDAAFRFLDVLPPEHRVVKFHFLTQIAQRLGLPDAVLPSGGDAIQRTAELAQLWEKCRNTADLRLKGRYLEDFVEAVFSHVFHIVSKDRLTDFGEIDLICEQRELNAFWGRWQSDFFVECKNHKDKSPVSDINEFIGKASVCGSSLSFFVSMTGFTKYAKDSMSASWGKPGVPDVVWVTGDDFERWLASSESVESFLKRLCRRANWGR